MHYTPHQSPEQQASFAKLKIEERERKRDEKLRVLDTSDAAQKRRLPRNVPNFIALALILVLVLVAVYLVYFLK